MFLMVGIWMFTEGFKIDTAISKSGDIKERQLERWTPDNSVPDSPSSWTPGSGSSQNWDQFQTNEKLFGVKTTFDEEIYTTKLDKTSEFYKQNESRAAKLASEISKVSLYPFFHFLSIFCSDCVMSHYVGV